jgi:hypothetical protein
MRHHWLATRVVAVASTLLTGLAVAVVPAVPAQAAVDLTAPFSREPVRPGDVDADQWHIEHVYEVQIRLRRLGLFDARPNGTFGSKTERAVRRFQRQQGLRVTGRVNAPTWVPLIKRSLRGRAAVPAQCQSPGWHVCYDRWWRQASLYHNGVMLNSWLVRGGAYDAQTRTGDFTVQWRSENHRSRTFGGAPMPYSQFFSGGQALHGSRNMMNPYVGHSHGCVNFWVEDARQLWNLTSDKALHVHVYGAWS